MARGEDTKSYKLSKPIAKPSLVRPHISTRSQRRLSLLCTLSFLRAPAYFSSLSTSGNPDCQLISLNAKFSYWVVFPVTENDLREFHVMFSRGSFPSQLGFLRERVIWGPGVPMAAVTQYGSQSCKIGQLQKFILSTDGKGGGHAVARNVGFSRGQNISKPECVPRGLPLTRRFRLTAVLRARQVRKRHEMSLQSAQLGQIVHNVGTNLCLECYRRASPSLQDSSPLTAKLWKHIQLE